MSQNTLVCVRSTGQLDMKLSQNKDNDRGHNSPSIFEEIRKSYLQKTLVSPSPNIRKTAFRL